jgi:hypothetical protein
MSLGQIDQTPNDHLVRSADVAQASYRYAHSFGFTVSATRANVWTSDRMAACRGSLTGGHMRGRKNPPLELISVAEGAPLTYDTIAQAYLEDYVLQRYRTLTTARARVEHLRGFFGGWRVEAITPDSVRNYQMHRRAQVAEAATVNRETSALSRMFQLAVRRGQLERMPLFPKSVSKRIRPGTGSSSTRST